MVVVEGQRSGSTSGRVLNGTYVWANRLLWPVVSGISGRTIYWTFALPRPELLVQVGGCVFGVFAAIGVLNSLLWWSGEEEPPD